MKIVSHAQEIVQNESKETAKPRVWAPRVFHNSIFYLKKTKQNNFNLFSIQMVRLTLIRILNIIYSV